MNESQLGALSRAYEKIAPHWPGLTARGGRPIGPKAIAAAVIWPRKPEPASDLRKADIGTLMRLSAAMVRKQERRAVLMAMTQVAAEAVEADDWK